MTVLQMKGGEVEARKLVQQCSKLVRLDNTADPMIQAHAMRILYHVECYLILIQHKTMGDYVNG